MGHASGTGQRRVMPRIGMRVGREWVSMSLTGWLVVWFFALPFVLAWLAVKLLVVIVRAVVVLVQAIDDRPAIPPPLRRPPPRQ
jgi:hypothetical protein